MSLLSPQNHIKEKQQEGKLIRNNLKWKLLSTRVNPRDIYEVFIMFLRILSHQKHCQVELKGEQRRRNERSLPDSKNSICGKQADKLLSCKADLHAMQKER